MQTQAIHVTDLSIDKFNPRRSVDSDAITQLAANIQAIGLVSPLVVRPAGDGKHTVLCGSRRLAAGRQAGLTALPCVVRELSDAEAAAVAVTEQKSHETLHFLELADGLLRWRDAGSTVEEIAEKMGWKRAYAYRIIGMAERLTPEAREACFEGKLNETNATELATVPRSAQNAALAKGLEPGLDGPKTTREWKEVIGGFRRDLTDAPFDTEDPTITCTEAGLIKCSDCKFRSGHSPDLFPDVSNPNLCTNAPGWESKADESWKRLMEDGAAHRGPPCLDPKQSDSYFNGIGALRDDAPYVEATAICYSDTAQRPYKSLLGQSYKTMVYLARVPKKLDVIELLGKEGLERALDEAGKIRRPPAAMPRSTATDETEKLSAEERRREREKVERRQKAIRKLLVAIGRKVEKRDFGKRELRWLAESLVRQGVAHRTLKRRDVQGDPLDYVAKLNEGQLRWFVWESNSESELYGDGGSAWPPALKELAKLVGEDPTDAEREVVAEEKAQPVKKEKSKKGAKAS